MGSGFAGLKAGVIAGIIYIGAIALFNVLILYAFKQDVLNVIIQQNPKVCPAVPTVNSTSAEDCFNSVVVGYIPYLAFLGFFISLLYAWVFGRIFDLIPAKGATTKGVMMALVVLINLVFFGLTGVEFNEVAAVSITVFVLAATAGYGILIGRLYVRYTKRVSFGGAVQSLKIMVDGRDFTGKVRTFATKSVHNIRAESVGASSFKEWVVSGGVTVEDNRSFETSMDVNGDGILRADWKKQ
ncbi:MAG TPA: hypothetical protein VLY21_07455 [Nitrososphaerales archaeon]|nr:hypothetical protein [Nitrososphaerales archaeon]